MAAHGQQTNLGAVIIDGIRGRTIGGTGNLWIATGRSLTLGGETRTNWPSGGSGAVTLTTAGRLGGGAVATNAFALTFDETGLLTNVPPLDYSILTNAPWVTASVTNGLLTAVPEGIGYLASNQTWTGNQTISNFLAIGTTPATALYIQSNGIRTDAHGASAWGVDVIGAQLFGGPWVDDSGYKFLTAATGVTNNGYTIISGITTSLVANGGSVTIGSTSTNGLATTSYVNGITNGLYLASNPSGYVTAIVTNGLASTVYVNSQGFVTQSVTNGLISSVTGPGLTTAAGGVVTLSTNGWTMGGGGADPSITNGLQTAFTAQWTDVVRLTDWLTPFGGPTANSNAIAPIWIFSAAATNDVVAFGDTSSQTILQDTYRLATFDMPFGSTAWGGETAMTFRVWSSTNDAALSKVDLKLVSPTGVIASTNGLTGGTANFVDYYFTTNWLPTFARSNATNSWRLRLTRYVKSGATNGCGTVRFNVK